MMQNEEMAVQRSAFRNQQHARHASSINGSRLVTHLETAIEVDRCSLPVQ